MRCRCALVFALLGLPAAAFGADCLPATVDAAVGARHSSWREYDEHGRQLLREAGVLHGFDLRLAGRCGQTSWAVGLGQEEGNRHYEGRTNLGRPLQTVSEVDSQVVRVQVGRDFAGVGIFLGTSLRQIRRALASVDSVRGYAEHYRFTEIDLGAERRFMLESGLAWNVEARAGWAPPARLRPDLPSRDPLRLDTGPTWQLALRAGLEGALPISGPGVSWSIRADLAHSETAAGPFAAVRQQGVIVGSARQPRMRQHSTGAAFMLRWAL